MNALTNQTERIGVAMTTFNRKDLTVRCLSSLQVQARSNPDLLVRAFVADDASTDGTPQALRNRFSELVEIVEGPGSWYWATGTHEAMKAAASWKADRILLLNDDVDLDPDALDRARLQWDRFPEAILVGAVREARETMVTTYSGVRRLSSRPGHLAMAEPRPSGSTEVDTFHGNFVVIPRSVVRQVGLVDGEFQHAYGDIDYGLRASAAGVPVQLMPGYFGVCQRNPPTGTWTDAKLTRARRLRLLFGFKGYPVRSHARFVRRHGGRLWPAYLAATYAKALSRIAVGR